MQQNNGIFRVWNLDGEKTFTKKSSSGCACELHQSIKEIAIQGRIQNKGLAQALNFKTMKDVVGNDKCIIPTITWTWGAFWCPWDDDDATYSSYDKLYQIAACKPLVGGNDVLAKGIKNVDHLLRKLLQCKREEAKEEEEWWTWDTLMELCYPKPICFPHYFAMAQHSFLILNPFFENFNN